MYETEAGNSVATGVGGLRSWDWRLGPRLRAVPFEALVWIVGVGAMAMMDPTGAHLLTLCPLDALGLSFCPGCGLGHAVAYLARGDIAASLQAHPLGIPAVLVLGTHTGRLLWSAAVHRAHRYHS